MDRRAFVPADPVTLLQDVCEVTSPVLQVILERARVKSRPGARTDDHLVCLAVEGGGMRGAVSAGMCVVLEAAGLVPAFDRIYGVSAGALNGWATAAGQAALSATHYQDAANRRMINPMRPLVGRPVIDFDFLFDDVIGARKPLSFAAMSGGPEFRALATSLETLSLRVLASFSDANELAQAVRASSSLPRLGGRPPLFRGERMVDGGMIEAIPFETALREGATHVLVLRSRPAGYRKTRRSELSEALALRDDPRLAGLLKGRRGGYNRQAVELERVTADGGSRVLQIAVPEHTRLIGRLETSPTRVIDALRIGAEAMGAAIFTKTIDLCWQPAVYESAGVTAAAREPSVSPAARWRPLARGDAAGA